MAQRAPLILSAQDQGTDGVYGGSYAPPIVPEVRQAYSADTLPTDPSEREAALVKWMEQLKVRNTLKELL